MEQNIKKEIIDSYSKIALGGRRSCGCSADEEWTGVSESGTGRCCAPAKPRPGDAARAQAGAGSTAATASRKAEEGTVEPDLGCGAPLGYADLSPGQTVLDLGSGSGREVFIAAREVGDAGRALGLDMTPAMVDLARENARKLGIRNAGFILGDIERMPLDDRSVDRVISNCVLNLTTDKEKAFSEIHRVLREGGKFAISDIVSTGPLPESIRSDPKLWCDCVAGALPVNEYLDAARKAGFRDVTIVSRRGDPSCGGPGLGLLSITVTGRK